MNDKIVISGFADEIDPKLDEQLKVVTGLGMNHISLRAADGKGIVATTWNILPIAEGQYAISSVGSDKVMRLLNAQTLGSETDELPDTDLNGTGFAWAFSQADTEVGINTVTQQDGNVRVENGRIIAPEGAKVNVFTPEGVEMPADSKLMPGIYIVTVNGKATKILVH